MWTFVTKVITEIVPSVVVTVVAVLTAVVTTVVQGITGQEVTSTVAKLITAFVYTLVAGIIVALLAAITGSPALRKLLLAAMTVVVVIAASIALSFGPNLKALMVLVILLALVYIVLYVVDIITGKNSDDPDSSTNIFMDAVAKTGEAVVDVVEGLTDVIDDALEKGAFPFLKWAAYGLGGFMLYKYLISPASDDERVLEAREELILTNELKDDTDGTIA